MSQHSILVTDVGYSGLNPVVFGYENCESSHHFGPAVRKFWLIHFVVSGCGIYKINNNVYKVKAGEMFVIPPFEETYYEADFQNPWSYIWIGFSLSGELPKQLPPVIHCPEASTIFAAMKNCENFSGGRSAFLAARLWDLFALLLREESGNNDYVSKALECIRSEYMNDITVEKIAKRLSLDRTYFSLIFKKKTGMSPKQYLLDYRMKVAAELIALNGVSVTVAARSVGYSDVYTFSKMFKKQLGIPPSKYFLKE